MNAVYHQLKGTGNWRVTDAPAKWQEGDLYPETKSSDRIFNNEADARAEYERRITPPATDEDSD